MSAYIRCFSIKKKNSIDSCDVGRFGQDILERTQVVMGHTYWIKRKLSELINLRSVILGQVEKGKEASTRTVTGESNDREEKENADTGRVRKWNS